VLLTILEILLTIVTPLLALYLRGRWPLRTVTACLFGIAVLWYLTYAPIHELSHAVGTLLVGGRVVDIKLIPSFWEGTFAVAWVTTAGLDQPWQQLVMGGAPYVIDVASVVASLVALRRRLSTNALFVGLLLMLMGLRPTFDLVCETVGFASGYRGDLWHIQLIIGSTALWSFLVVSLALCLLSVVVVLRRYGGFPARIPIRFGRLTAATAHLRGAVDTAPGRRGAADHGHDPNLLSNG
jgi:hypothetical protein